VLSGNFLPFAGVRLRTFKRPFSPGSRRLHADHSRRMIGHTCGSQSLEFSQFAATAPEHCGYARSPHRSHASRPKTVPSPNARRRRGLACWSGMIDTGTRRSPLWMIS
jgi:hypothetical protein